MKQETNKKWIITIIFTMIISTLFMILNMKKYNIYDVNKDEKVNNYILEKNWKVNKI